MGREGLFAYIHSNRPISDQKTMSVHGKLENQVFDIIIFHSERKQYFSCCIKLQRAWLILDIFT